MNKTKVLVFTKIGGWDNMFLTIRKRVNKKEWAASYPSQNSGIVRFESIDNKAKLVPVDLNQQSIIGEDGIFLVYDELYEVKPTEFESLKEQCSGDTIYILAHKNGKYPTEKFANWGCKGYKEESHLPDPGNSYSKFFDILTDSEGKKRNRIINQVFQPVLELVLRFLHGCLGDARNPEFDKAYKELCSIEDVNGCVTEFYEKYFSENRYIRNDNNKIEDLTKVRDQLLEYVSTQPQN